MHNPGTGPSQGTPQEQIPVAALGHVIALHTGSKEKLEKYRDGYIFEPTA